MLIHLSLREKQRNSDQNKVKFSHTFIQMHDLTEQLGTTVEWSLGARDEVHMLPLEQGQSVCITGT